MSSEMKRRVPGKRVFPADDYPKLRLVSPQTPVRTAPKVEPSPEVKEMLREMNRRHTPTRNTDTPDAA
jgi:hypothetical protein